MSGRRKIIGLGLLLALVVVGVGLFSTQTRPQVVGTLAADDLTEIVGRVRQELRTQFLPRRDNWLHVRHVIRNVGDYYRQRILWVKVREDGGVEVFAGTSKAQIQDRGHIFSLRKNLNWELTGYEYWTSSNVAPVRIEVPAGP